MTSTLPDVQRLRLLCEVARCGSIAAASRASGVTASAVSQQIAVLEREVGVTLVERGHRGVTLTGAGRVLVDKATQVLRVLEETRTEMDQLSGEPAGTVRVGAIASAAMSIVLPATDRLRSAHPDVSLHVSALEPSVSIDRVAGGGLDVAVIDIYDHAPVALPERLHVVEILSEPLVVVRPRGSRAPRALADLADDQWVMPPESAACGRAVRHACRAAGFEPRVGWETDDLLLLVESVARGHGVALLPRLAVAANLAAVSISELADGPLRRRILTVTTKSSASRPVVAVTLDALHARPGRPRTADGVDGRPG